VGALAAACRPPLEPPDSGGAEQSATCGVCCQLPARSGSTDQPAAGTAWAAQLAATLQGMGSSGAARCLQARTLNRCNLGGQLPGAREYVPLSAVQQRSPRVGLAQLRTGLHWLAKETGGGSGCCVCSAPALTGWSRGCVACSHCVPFVFISACRFSYLVF
jgi:hypothetical protein